ncbi:hypothetical protein F2Q68_00045439 [Brassica cretica]|uniref:Uncharacterized protein n=1 Tax=Brassica cretica TaxID=69181 RepID=A0A8S9LLX2_BRACR|nr:hypothetical protein F2Q68_00045439 [Brassica cretica]
MKHLASPDDRSLQTSAHTNHSPTTYFSKGIGRPAAEFSVQPSLPASKKCARPRSMKILFTGLTKWI